MPYRKLPGVLENTTRYDPVIHCINSFDNFDTLLKAITVNEIFIELKFPEYFVKSLFRSSMEV